MTAAVIKCKKVCKHNRGSFCNCFPAKHYWAEVMDEKGKRWTVGPGDVCRWRGMHD